MPTPPRNARLSNALYEVAGQPCSFTVRCALGRAPFHQEEYARIAVRCLLEQQTKSTCRLLCYCVMPDHVHLIVAPDRDGCSSLHYVDRFKGWSSRELHLAGWQGDIWQPRSYDHVVRQDDDLAGMSSYILANPVRAGLVADQEDYPWSGIPG